MSIFDKFRHHDDNSQPTEQAVATPVDIVAPEASAEALPVTNPAALELARAADELGGIVATETQQTGSLDVAAPTAAVEPPTVAEQVAALDTAPASEVSTYETPAVPQEEVVADDVPNVTAMSSEDIHEALGIPPIETPVAPVAEAPSEPTTPEQPVQNQ